jgi:hypothetical protein
VHLAETHAAKAVTKLLSDPSHRAQETEVIPRCPPVPAASSARVTMPTSHAPCYRQAILMMWLALLLLLVVVAARVHGARRHAAVSTAPRRCPASTHSCDDDERVMTRAVMLSRSRTVLAQASTNSVCLINNDIPLPVQDSSIVIPVVFPALH